MPDTFEEEAPMPMAPEAPLPPSLFAPLLGLDESALARALPADAAADAAAAVPSTLAALEAAWRAFEASGATPLQVAFFVEAFRSERGS
jgi:hypothetical protein